MWNVSHVYISVDLVLFTTSTEAFVIFVLDLEEKPSINSFLKLKSINKGPLSPEQSLFQIFLNIDIDEISPKV